MTTSVNDRYVEQIPFGTDSFADNPEPRCPCLLLLDTSGSMHGEPIAELNDGLHVFRDELNADTLAIKRVEVALVTFGSRNHVDPFQTAPGFIPPHLEAGGDTPMGEAISLGIDLVRQRKADYRANGISFYRPWIFLITDGEPTDAWQEAAEAVRRGEQDKAFAFFAVGVNGANMNLLSRIAVREPLRLNGLRFGELFRWLSNSMKSVSQSTPGDTVALPAPTGWVTV